MNAIEYLIARTWPSAWKVSAALLLGTLLSWVNMTAASLIPKMFPFLVGGDLGTVVWGCLAFVAAMIAGCTVLAIVLLVPLYLTYGCTSLIHAWTRQRVVEEMICAGISGSTILDRAALYAARWWVIAVGPSVLLGVGLFPTMAQMVSPSALVGYILAVACLSYLGAFATAWTGFCGGKVKTPLLGALAVVQGVPALALIAFGLNGTTMLSAAVYVVLTARWAAIYALENSESLRNLDNRVRRYLRVGSGSRRTRLDDNPILAREVMRGTDSSELIARGLTAACFALALGAAIAFQTVGMFLILLVAVVAFNCYRSAGRMSQIVTEELETSTLETLRATPMGSEAFLQGWLHAVLRPLFAETAVLLSAVGVAVAALGEGHRLGSGAAVMGIALCFALPLAGAYLGASIAGQGQSRSQISGQLVVSFGAFVMAAVPQAFVATEVLSVPASLGSLALMTLIFCSLLGAGAKKSLNRVFLPQR